MHKATDLKPLEIVEVFVTVFCFLKDSSQDSQTLLDDFRTCQGYNFLSEFLLKLEKTLPEDPEKLEEKESIEANEAMRNLVLLVASLSFCGHAELRSSSIADVASSSLFRLSTFELPEPENRGSTVRNVHAFQVLQSVFLKSTSVQLGSTIMDAISTIYTSDNANYFLLENQHTLPQCAERIYKKPKPVQQKFFQLVEFLVHHLKFVPCKELISLSLLIKGHSKNHPECCVLAIQTLIGFIKFDAAFKDVFREIGMLEVFIGNLKLLLEYLMGKRDRSEASQRGAALGPSRRAGNPHFGGDSRRERSKRHRLPGQRGFDRHVEALQVAYVSPRKPDPDEAAHFGWWERGGYDWSVGAAAVDVAARFPVQGPTS